MPESDPFGRWVAHLLENAYGRLVFVVDCSQTMTFVGHAPPTRSDKFPFVRRLVAGLGCSALACGVSVHLVPVGSAGGRRGPILRQWEDHATWIEVIESLRPGGARSFGYAVRNQILRGGPDATVVVISDFRDESWRQAIPALVAGEARVVLVHVVDASEDGDLQSATAENPETVPFAFERSDPELETPGNAAQVHARLLDLARDHRMELVGVLTDAEVEGAIVRGTRGS
ncbi:MAG: hypothetical protein ACKO5K_03555 [Armatimonadota bacterium]